LTTTAEQVVIRGVIVETGVPTGTHTSYTVVYKTGSVSCDVHEAIDRWLNDALGDIVAIYLVLPDPNSQPVWVEIHEASTGVDFELNISGNDTPIELVYYTDTTREAFGEHSVMVHGFLTEPAVPYLEE